MVTITEEDLAKARRDTPTIAEEDVRRIQRQHLHQPRFVPQPAPEPNTSPRIDALPKPLTPALPDLSAIARGYAAAAAPDGLSMGPSLLIFISLGMPPATLARLTQQAAQAQATMVLRGLSGHSLRETVVQVQKLIGAQQVAVQIDPQAFDRYAIQRVPAFVLARQGGRPATCASGSCPPPTDFASASGDVSLDYALEHLRRVSPGLEREAGIFLARLKR
ncbi:type-F conjugative transfer system pilin assembly protein TrbC [Roseateles flavus]|uniref:Type-F conjugative transfer system pilin assembly protein TrbC n=1 Tax=Roseateles flavus TaxID=3149041 RepID=A0ABV0GKM6_9BURK